MPPKKKKSAKKKGEVTDGDKLSIKTHEVEALKDNLAYRRDLSRRTKMIYDEMKEKLDETNKNIEEIEGVHKASSAFLTHQYKTMQNDMYVKMHNLETELMVTRNHLEVTESRLAQEQREKKQMLEAKNEKIAELESKINNLQIIYDSIVDLTLTGFNRNLDAKRSTWEDNSVQLQTKNKKLLAELGVNIHYI